MKEHGPKSSEIYKIEGWFNIPNGLNVSKSGFKGSRTSSGLSTLLELEGWVKSKSILKMVEGFQQVSYNDVCIRVCDSDGN